MYIPFEDIAFEARVWIYQAGRELTEEEVGTLTQTLKAATDGWEAHGKKLVASVKIFYKRFVVIAVDEGKELPSGCSIDKSTHWMKEEGRQVEVDFFDRSVAWLDDDGHVKTTPLSEVKSAIETETITPNTYVFDNLVENKAQWMKRWKTHAGQSWLQKYFSEHTPI